MADAPTAAVTRDALLGGRLLLDQPVKGHRVGTDAVLLAAAVTRDLGGRVYDAGSGVGAVGLAIAKASPNASVSLIERDPAYAALAVTNIIANGLMARATSVVCDLLSGEARRSSLPEPADLIVTNPPFYRPDRVRSSPQEGRRAAHVFGEEGSIDDWLRACLALLAAKGALVLIHRADALPELLGTLGSRLGALTLKAIHPRAGEPAVRVLLRGIKGSRAPLTIAPPLVLHDGDRFTPEAQRLHDGDSVLVW